MDWQILTWQDWQGLGRLLLIAFVILFLLSFAGLFIIGLIRANLKKHGF